MSTYKYENLAEYMSHVKEERASYFATPYDLVYQNFIALGYDKEEPSFFFENASNIVESLRAACWDSFTPIEKKFTSKMLGELIDVDRASQLTPVEAITEFVESYPDHIYQLSLSNTQSRRSRAGKEFEAILELLLIGGDIPMDTQGNIGKKLFVDKGLGKLVDVVSPSVVEYTIDKNDVILLSAKTTLRERWQEVPEEMSRTGAREMFLATLDETVSAEVLDTLYEANIRITTTESNKNTNYPNNKRIVTFEQLLEMCRDNKEKWRDYAYSDDEKNQLINSIKKQREKHQTRPFVQRYYDRWLLRIK